MAYEGRFHGNIPIRTMGLLHHTGSPFEGLLKANNYNYLRVMYTNLHGGHAQPHWDDYTGGIRFWYSYWGAHTLDEFMAPGFSIFISRPY